MNIFRKLFGKKRKFSWAEFRGNPPSIHISVFDECRYLIASVLNKRGIVRDEAFSMKISGDWFKMRERRYGESGSHYGVAELVADPTKSDPPWPPWLKLIPTSELGAVAGDIYTLVKERRPPGGHNNDYENRKQAVCDFAGQLLSWLLDREKEARLKARPEGQ